MEVNGFALARSEDSPWALAKARFLDDLEPSERQLYNNATLENIYYATSNANRKDAENSRTRTVVRKLGPLVSAIESYGKAVDTFAQIAPLYQAPIWGFIRVLLAAAEAHSKFYDRIVDVLARIGDILPRFRDYERIYNPQKHKRLVQALSDAYLDIIVLCTQFRQSIRAHQASKVRRVFKPLSMSQQADDAIERFRRHKQNVEDEAKLCHMLEAAEERESRLTLFAAERRRRILARLSNIDCGLRHRRLQGTRHEGTGVWLQQHGDYIKWESSTGPAVLCCYGIPGCGKSILVSTIIDTLKRQHVTIFYYCDYADKRTLFPSNVFGTLARQILERVELIPEALSIAVEEADHNGDRLADDSEALLILQKCMESSPRELHIILDGLDECTEHSQKVILDGLRQVMYQKGSTVKLLTTARADLDALLKLKPSILSSRIPILSSTIAMDIEAYVRASTRNRIIDGSLVIGDADLEEVIVCKLVNGAKGMFLWVEFQLNDLCDADSDHHIKKVLDNLPKSLSETYDRLLGRIEGKERAVMIERMFKWLVCTRQPLHVDELREGIAFTLDDTQQDQDKIITDLNRLVRACSNLVIIDAETKVVQLSHYTVEQYLLQPAGSKFQFTRLEADIMAGEFCVAYLSFADFETRITPYKENVNTDLVALGKLASHPTLMAPDHPGHTVVRIWHSLRNSAPAAASIDMTKILRKSPPSQELSQYRCLPYTIKHWIRHSSHFLSENVDGDFRVRRRRKLFHDLVLEKNLPFQFRPWEDCVPVDKDLVPEAILGWGLMENHLALIELALGEAAHLPYNSPGSDKLAFFHSNIQKAWVDLFARNRLDTIVDKEIAIADDTIEEFPACSYTIGSPIHSWIFYRLLSACRKGHLEAVKACMLHRYAADGNRDAISYLIVVAATHGHLSLLEELWPYCGQTAISLKAKIGHNGICLNALECAIVSGHDAIVNFLHVAGCKIALFNDNESFFGLLDKAAYQMDIELLDTLFLLGLTALTKDTISHDSRVLNTLVKAVEKDHHTVVEAMLRHGANPDVPAKSGMTPIFHSILRSSIASLKVLLSYNASTGVTSLGLPLTLAASIGNPDIVEVLLSYNADMNVDVPRDGGFLPSVYQGYDPEMPFSLWKDYLCPTPLYVACYHGHLAVSRMLQEHGASPYLASPKFSTWISRQNHETVCKTRLYHLAIDRPLEAFQTPRLGDYPLWETPLDAALSRGHGSMFRTLTSTTENDPVVPEHDFAEDEIDPTSLLVHRQHNLHPWIEEALSNISSKSCSDPTANLEVLLAAGVDLRAVRLGDQPLIFWALENHPMCLKALPDARAYWADIPVHAFQELARLDILHTSRISSFMLGIAKYLALALRESPSYVRGILRDVFIYIVYSTNHTCEDTLIANSIIQAIGSCRRTADGHVRFKSPNTDQKTERLSGYEIEAIKSAYGHDNTPQGIDMLNELFDSLCSEGSEFEHFTNHFPPLFAAIKHQKDDLVREWYSSRDSAFFRGYRQRCSNLVFAIKAGSTLSILTFVLEEESKLGICCDTDDLGKTAFDKAWAAKDTTAVDLLKSWHGNGSWEEGDLWCCKFRRNRVVS